MTQEHEAVLEQRVPVTDDRAAWMRLDARMIWVDAVQTLLSLAPAAIATWVVGIEPTWGSMWPFALVAAWGMIGAARNVLRWIFTRYRVTDEYVERRTGVLVRRYRSVRRDRIRSIDVTAKLRHRVAGLRVVLIGAGQQLAAGESALALDALNRHDAAALRRTLHSSIRGEPATDPATPADPSAQVLARFRPWWVAYHLVGIRTYVMGAGLLWGGYWLVRLFGVDPAVWVGHRLDPDELGWPVTVGVALLVTGVVGAAGMGVSFFATHWRFELARVPGDGGTQLRTRQGLLTTREVNRDDRRLRGATISEPWLWRWMGIADTEVITTGLSVFSSSQPAAILPRGPVAVARAVAAEALDVTPTPFGRPLIRHPSGALRRRLWWATFTAAAVTAVLCWLAANGAVPATAPWWGAGFWVVALGGAVVAYRALGHAIVGQYLVVRSGLVSRTTTALRRDAISTIALRESVLQRRLGLRTVSAMTAAGWGIYEAPDIEADDALALAVEAAPGLLEPFLVTDGAESEVRP